MDDLVQFLRDRYDEEARLAISARDEVFCRDGRWTARGPFGDGDRFGSVQSEVSEAILGEDTDNVPFAYAAHIAHHHPDRALREVDAKRRILNVHRSYVPEPDSACLGCAGGIQFQHCPVVRLLSLPYTDHPDYRDTWRP